MLSERNRINTKEDLEDWLSYELGKYGRGGDTQGFSYNRN